MPIDKLLQRFVRWLQVDPSSQQELPFIDGFRALAVSMVVALHTWQFAGGPLLLIGIPLIGGNISLGHYLQYGSWGVSLFFILSGFLLSQAWFAADSASKPTPDLRRYFRRRFLRIAPAYYACLAAMFLFLVPYLIPAHQVYSWSGAKHVFAHLVFAQQLFLSTHLSWNVSGQFWTLTTEALFYLFLPLLVVGFLKSRWLIALPVCIAISYFWSGGALNHFDVIVNYLAHRSDAATPAVQELDGRYLLQQWFPTQLHYFAYGIVLANLTVRAQALVRLTGRLPLYARPQIASLYFPLGAALVLFEIKVIGYGHLHSLAFAGVLYVGLGFALMVAGGVFGGLWVRQVFSFAPLRIVGIVSYSIYLWHLIVIRLVGGYTVLSALTPGERAVFLTLRLIPLVLLISILSYVFIEKPFLVRARGQRPQLPPAAAPAAVREVVGVGT